MNKTEVRFHHFIPLLSITISLLITTIMFACWYSESKSRLDFEYVREGLCIYSDCVYTGDKTHPYEGNICWVIDYETEKVIEVDIYNDTLYCEIEPGDIIGYIVDYDYTDADLLYVIKGD